jgi:hypothetical protein
MNPSQFLPFQAEGLGVDLGVIKNIASQSKEGLMQLGHQKANELPEFYKGKLEKLNNAVFNGDVAAKAEIMANVAATGDASHIQMNAIVFKYAPIVAEKLFKDDMAAGQMEVAKGAIILGATLMLGALIIVKFYGAAITACDNDTEAIAFIDELFGSTKSGLVILGLAIMAIGGGVALRYLNII